jgi:hypothetical protein
MTKPLWQLLQEEPSTLSCDECFAVMEYYAELLAQGGETLLPEIMNHLEGCPSCRIEHLAALQRLVRVQEGGAAVVGSAPTASSLG